MLYVAVLPSWAILACVRVGSVKRARSYQFLTYTNGGGGGKFGEKQKKKKKEVENEGKEGKEEEEERKGKERRKKKEEEKEKKGRGKKKKRSFQNQVGHSPALTLRASWYCATLAGKEAMACFVLVLVGWTLGTRPLGGPGACNVPLPFPALPFRFAGKEAVECFVLVRVGWALGAFSRDGIRVW